MSVLMTDNAAKRLTHLRERQRIRRRAAENKISVAIGLKNFSDPIAHPRRPAILAIGRGAVGIGFLQGSPSLGANRCGVIARKFVALYGHDLCYASFRSRSISAKKRLPDRSEPWASGVCQANLLHLLLKIA